MRASPIKNDAILVIFDGDEVTDGLTAVLAAVGAPKAVHISGLSGLAPSRPIAIVYDVDIDHPHVARQLKIGVALHEWRRIPRLLVTDRHDVTSCSLNALLEVSGIIGKPIDDEAVLQTFGAIAAAGFEQTLTRQPREVRAALSGLNQTFARMLAPQGTGLAWADVGAMERPAIEAVRAAALGGWLDAVQKHHSSTFRHCLSVTGIAVAFAQHLGFDDADQRRIARGAIFHDIGKASIPLEILDKPGKLSTDEMRIMQRHPRIGFDQLAQQADVPQDVLDVVLSHHELLDGSGYPEGLRGNQIPLTVRLITISDIFSALVERRSYKPPMEPSRAYSIVSSMGGLLDRDLVRSFEAVARSASVPMAA